jgi:hypothetical protein
MKNNSIWLILLIAFFPVLSFGQTEYYSTDSATSAGIELVDGSALVNSRLCQVKKGAEIIEYTPYEVKEFGFKDGRVYISKEIQLPDTSKKVFLERLQKGRLTLYYYRAKGIRTYFIERDSTLFVEIPKQNTVNQHYSDQLSILTHDCTNVSDACKLVKYNKRSLSELIARYNNCELKPFPHFRYGLLVGYEFLKLNPLSSQNEFLEYFNFHYDGSFSIGLFLDQPVFVSDFSLHAELIYSKHGYSYNKLIDNKDLDFVANISSLKLPFLLRYVYPSNKFRPFVNTGLIASYIIKNETLLYETIITQDKIVINDTETNTLIDDVQIGFSIGGGIENELNSKHSLFFELRYNNLYNYGDSEFRGISNINILTGINF